MIREKNTPVSPGDIYKLLNDRPTAYNILTTLERFQEKTGDTILNRIQTTNKLKIMDLWKLNDKIYK